MINLIRARRAALTSAAAALGLAAVIAGGNPALAATANDAPTSGQSALELADIALAGGASRSDAKAAQPYFRIFYGQNCYAGGTGSRAYFGTNSGEAWINDRYTEGGAGNGQYIRKNAASVFVANGKLQITGGPGTVFFPQSSVGKCWNLDSLYRNQNTSWKMSS